MSNFWEELHQTIAIHNEIAKRNIIGRGSKETGEENKQIKKLENSIINSILNRVETDKLEEIEFIRTLFQKTLDLEFDKTMSLNLQQKDESPALSAENRYLMLSKINLQEHTLGMAINSLDHSEKLPPIIRTINLIIAILHDFGKSPALKKFSEGHNNRHDQISAYYFKFLVKSEKHTLSNEWVTVIFSTLFNHHNNTLREDDKSEWLKTLIQDH